MSPLQLIFLIVSTVGLLTALGTVLARNLVHAALFLVAFFFTVACQFVLLEAEFLAAMQVLIYIGAVSILLLFGIMLTRNIQGDETTGGHWGWKLPAGIVAFGVLGVLLFGITAERGRPGQESWVRINSRPGGVNPRIGGPDSLALAYSPTGQFIASADADGRIRLWTIAGQQRSVLHLEGLAPSAVTFSPDASLIAAADGQGRVRAWQTLSNRTILDRSGGLPGSITSVAVSPPQFEDEGANLMVATGGADGIVRVWVGPDPVEIEAHNGAVLAMTFTSEGHLVTAGSDRRVVTWNLLTGESTSIPSSSEGRPIGALTLGLVPPPEPVASDPQGPPPPPPPPPAAGGVSGPLVAVASLVSGEPGRWDLRVLNIPDRAEVTRVEGLSGIPIAVSVASDARRVAALVLPAPSSDSNTDTEADENESLPTVQVWPLDPEVARREPVAVDLPEPVGPFSQMAAGPQSVRLALAPEDGPIRFYDDRDGVWTASRSPTSTTATVIADMPRAVGMELMTRSVVPFEVAGLMLTAALVGAIVLARQERRDAPKLPDPLADRLASGRPIPPSGLTGEPEPSLAGASEGSRTPGRSESPGARSPQ
ncbi:NADH-quinone oxidoreductase subunit J [Tautonia marina]|uniref:NADH-quinone oxidoreductase subunit J n=1 Tax=Tautonia marina TaxID=2653855 RepID=UPI001260861D|nr:NADH-quinone oxidoreductase subunit J [Tautonia marina]